MSVVVVGSINVDLHLRVRRHPLPGETLLASGGEYSPGGKGANQACAAALAGASTTMLGAIGSDGAREVALRLLDRAGVGLAHLVEVGGPTGLAVVTVDAAGENTVLVVPGANSLMKPEMIDGWGEVISAAQIVVAQGEIPAASTVAAARRMTGRLLLNLAPVIELDPAIIRSADPLVVNEHEAALVLTQLGETGATDPDELVSGLLAAGVTSVVLTLGSAGVVVGTASDRRHIASPVVVAKDSVGAGDAFVGALAARLDAGASLVDAATYACRFAAYTVQFDGAQSSYPTPGTPLPEV